MLKYLRAIFTGDISDFVAVAVACEEAERLRRWQARDLEDRRAASLRKGEYIVSAAAQGVISHNEARRILGLSDDMIEVTCIEDPEPRYIGKYAARRVAECKNCGGSVGPHEHRCSWCGSYPESRAE